MKKQTADNLKILGASTIAAVLFSALYALTRRVEVVIILFVGLTVVAIVAAVYVLASKALERRRAAKGGAPGKDPGLVKEKTEKLRGSFEAGLEKITKSGKDIYEVPWLLMMGLSSTGKTEAIRNSGLEFPPTLHEENQGHGGTQKLDWWFSKEAVILDTIGEWITEDHGEWAELLLLLKLHRPLAPINGVVFAISAESLILDPEDKIKSKAAAVARKLDSLQQGLGIRFPVFVMVTKTDLVTGFRSFFSGDETQDFRNQLVGWSNPAGLEDKFDASRIDSALEPFFDSLRAHRMNIFTAMSSGAATLNPDQALRMMTFPENIRSVLPKLKIWMETVFMGSEWVARPLFLRGVYFTSAKQAGWEMDVELSRKFPIPESGRIEERNPGRQRAHFLRDLFVRKAIMEKGLVLRADRRRKSRKIGQVVTWSVALLVLVSFIFLTRFGYNRLEKAVGQEQAYWEAAAEENFWQQMGGRQAWKPVVSPSSQSPDLFVYSGTDLVFEQEKIDTGKFLDAVARKSSEKMDIPWIFRMSAGFSRELDSSRPVAAKALFQASVLLPVVHAARVRLSHEKPESWTPAATSALAQILKLEMRAKKGGADEAPVDLDVLFQYVLEGGGSDYDSYKQLHSTIYLNALKTLSRGSAWDPRELGAGSPEAATAVEHAKNAFAANWSRQVESQKSNAHLQGVAALTEAGLQFLKFEKALLDVNAPFAPPAATPATAVTLNRIAGDWDNVFSSVAEAREAIERNVGLLSAGTLESAYDQRGARAIEEIESSFKIVLDALSGVEEMAPAPGSEEDYLVGFHRDIVNKLTQIKNAFRSGKVREDIRKLDAEAYRVVAAPEFGRPAQRACDTRFGLYSRAADALRTQVRSPDMFSLTEEIQASAAAYSAARDEIRKRVSGPAAQSDPMVKKALDCAMFAVALAEKAAVFSMVKSAVDSLRNSTDRFENLAKARSSILDPIQRTRIFMLKPPSPHFDQRFNPTVMREVAKNRKLIVRHLGDPDVKDLKPEDPLLDADQMKALFAKTTPALRNYFGAAADYWIAVAREGMRVPDFTWQEFTASLREFQQWEINTALNGTLNIVEEALKDPDLPFDGPVKERIEALRKDMQAARNLVRAQEGQDNLFLAQCKNVAGGWGAFKDMPPAAVRLRLLETTPQRLKDSYVISGSGDFKDIILQYWEDLSWRALMALAQDFQRNSADALGEMKTCQVFPLAAFVQDRSQLGVDKIEQCRKLLEGIRPSLAMLPKSSVGTGEKTNIPRIDATIDQLAWLKMTPEDRKWVLAADTVLAALPDRLASAFSCEVVLPSVENQKKLADRAQEDYQAVSSLLIWRSVEMIQGGERVVRRSPTDPAEDRSLGKFAYPGAKLDVLFYKNPSDEKPDVELAEEGPWGPVALLHRFGATRMEDPRVWLVALTAKDAKGFQRKIWLQLKFDRVLPELKDWPR